MNGKRAGCRQGKTPRCAFAATIGLLIALFTVCPRAAHAESQDAGLQTDDTLQISIAFDKESYAADEKVHAVVTGTNASDEPLRDVNLLVAVPEGWHASGNTQASVAKMAARASQTLDVYLERNADPAPNTSPGNNAASTANATGTGTTGTSKTISATGASKTTDTASTTKTTLATTADPSMSMGLLCAEGLVAVVAGIVLVRRGSVGDPRTRRFFA